MKVTELLKNPDYIKLITDIVDIKSNIDGHKVLIVGDRLEFLNSCHEKTPNSRIVTSYTEDRLGIFKEIMDGEANSIYGTTSIFKEGINIPALSCLILGSPINNDPLLEQVIGRVTRPYPGKRNPEIIDIVLNDPVSKRQFAQRLNYYISRGYKLVELHSD